MAKQSKSSGMTGVAAFIVDHRKIIALVFAVLMVFSVISMNWVNLEEDIIQFLPEEAESKVALRIMSREFKQFGYAQIVIENVTKDEALELQEKLSQIEHVKSAEFDPESGYKENSAFIEVSMDTLLSDKLSNQTIAKIQQALEKNEAYMYYGDDSANSAAIVTEQMSLVIVIFAVLMIAILLLVSNTYGEVLVLILTFAAAALINMGTHFLFGTISLVSSAVSVVMQLALSMDYAIILSNRYKEERAKKGAREAAVKALAESIPAISSSSLTTIAGLFAMTLMTFRLGYDLGTVLIKAIVISLLSVFVLMPALLVMFDKLMMRTKHRSFVPKVSFIGRFAYATRKVFPIIFAALIVAGCFLNTQTKYSYNYVYTKAFNETDSDYALRIIGTRFQENMFMALLPAGNYEAEKAMLDEIETWDNVNSTFGLANTEVMDGVCLCDSVDYKTLCEVADVDETAAQALFAYYAAERGDHRYVQGKGLDDYKVPLIDAFEFVYEKLMVDHVDEKLADEDIDFELDQETKDYIEELYQDLKYGKDQLMSDDYSAIMVYAQMPPQGPEVSAFVEKVHDLADKYYGDQADEIKLYGDSMFYRDFETSFSADNRTVSLLSILFVVLILFLTFKSGVLALLLIAVIQGSIWLNFSIPVLTNEYVYFGCFLIVSAIQMGSNIDYAIVMSSRYLELRKTMGKRDAIINAVNLAFPTVMTSGLMMACAGILMALRVSENVTAGIGRYMGTGAAISMLVVLFMLPQILVLFDKWIYRSTLKDFGPVFRRRAWALGLGLLALALFILFPISGIRKVNAAQSENALYAQKLDTIDRYASATGEFESKGDAYDQIKFDFAKSYITDKIGREELAAGQKELEAGRIEYEVGKTQLESGQELYDEMNAMYQDGLATYTEGKQEYNAGLAEYAAGQAEYKSGMAQYEAGKRAYEEGLAEYNAGKKAYEEGLLEYNTGLAQYNQAKEMLGYLQEAYDAAVETREEYLSVKKQYEDAVASGDQEQIELVETLFSTVESLYTASLGDYGSISDLLAAYEDAQVELADAEQELKEGEQALAEGKAELEAGERELAAGRAQLQDAQIQLAVGKSQLDAGDIQLADGRAELDAGGAELADAKQQLADGKQEIDAGKQQLADGEKELADGEKELADGIQFLNENGQVLTDSLDVLDEYKIEKTEVERVLKEVRMGTDVKTCLADDAGYVDTLDSARGYFDEQTDLVRASRNKSFIATILLAILALAALIAAIWLWLTAKKNKKKQAGEY